MTDTQFNDAITTAGKWFFLTQYELIRNSSANTNLVDLIYKAGFDTDKSGTSARVSAVKRIIQDSMDKKALLDIAASQINNEHPDTKELANLLLKKYF